MASIISSSATATAPEFTDFINQQFFIEPLGGPQHPKNYLDRFPEEIYNKSLDSHLVKFMYALLGPAGAGWLRKNYLEARLLIEDFGLEIFDLDQFYGNPLRFGRVVEEIYDDDPDGLLPRDAWDRIRAKDAMYRNRAIDFLNAARAGNTPLGIHLASRSGLGHEAEIIENYKYLYDSKTDDPLGLNYQGRTLSTEEFIIIPRKDLPRNEVQTITIYGDPTDGTFSLSFKGDATNGNATPALAYNVSTPNVQLALENLASINPGDVRVTGGPLPTIPIKIYFTGSLAMTDVPAIRATSSLIGGVNPYITITTDRSGIESADEVVNIPSRDFHHLQEALDRIRPVDSIVSTSPAPGLTNRVLWNEVVASSTYTEVIRYVTGLASIPWPVLNSTHWIESSREHEAPRVNHDLQQHYQGFHNVASITSYTEDGETKDNHIGPFSQTQQFLFSPLNIPVGDVEEFTPDRAIAQYPEPLTITTQTESGISLINGIYPQDYQDLPGAPILKNHDSFWASLERESGNDYLEIDLGTPQAVNYLSFDVTRKPFDINVEFDLLDQYPDKGFIPVTFNTQFPNNVSLGYDFGNLNSWQTVELHFFNSLGKMIFTRFIRLGFARRATPPPAFVAPDGSTIPYSIEVRNLRIGRNL